PFKAHVADKRGNIYVAQGDADKAKVAFLEAYQGLTAADHKIFVAKKLSLLGVDVQNATGVEG
ncbi:MAG: tetratricopeptide repeat protein, partial [Saezia sp.]